MKKLVLFLSFLILFSACEKDLGPTVEGVQVTVGNDSITIINGTDTELRFFVVNQESLSIIDWAPYCLENGLIIPAAEKETVAFTEIFGYETNCQIVVHWWSCSEVNGKPEAGDIQSIVVSSTP